MKLKEICTVFSDGDWIESKSQSDKGIRLIQTGNIGEGKYLEKTERAKYISEDTFKELKCTEIFSGDILVSRLPEPIGRACIIPDKSERMITAVDCTICRVNENIANREYICYFMQSQLYYNRLLGNVTGTTRKRISRKNLGNIELVIPTLNEQKAIVKKLNYLTKGINLRRKELEYLDTLIKARFIEMFGDWIKEGGRPLSELATITGGLTKNSKREAFNLKMPYLRVANVFFNRLDLNEIQEIGIRKEEIDKTLLQKGDLLFVEGNGSIEQIGRVAIWDGSINPILHQNHLIKARFSAGTIIPEFALFYFMSQEGRQQIISKSVSTSGLNTLSVNKIGSLILPVPPIILQEQFADFVNQVNKSKVAVQKALDEAQLLFDSLMQEYFG